METHTEPEPDFASFYREWWGVSLKVAQRLVGSALAEDVAADAFVKAVIHWERLRKLPHSGPWILRVTVRLALRRRRHSWQSVLDVPAESAMSIDDLVVTQMALTEALASLPRRQREVLALRYLGDLSEHETALALRLSPETVKTHARRGLIALRRHWSATVEPSKGG